MPYDAIDKDHVSLLLFLECRAVDQRGAVDIRHMNAEDMALAAEWADEGFVRYGRICSADIPYGSFATAWVYLSDRAHDEAAKARRERARRMWGKREFRTAEEFREEAAGAARAAKGGAE